MDGSSKSSKIVPEAECPTNTGSGSNDEDEENAGFVDALSVFVLLGAATADHKTVTRSHEAVSGDWFLLLSSIKLHPASSKFQFRRLLNFHPKPCVRLQHR